MADIKRIKLPGSETVYNLNDANAVKFTSQTLTDEQKSQARSNIDATKVSASATGSATDSVSYITIDGVEKKLPAGLPTSATAGDAIVYNGTEWAKQDGYGYTTPDDSTTFTWDGETTGKQSIDMLDFGFDQMFLISETVEPLSSYTGAVVSYTEDGVAKSFTVASDHIISIEDDVPIYFLVCRTGDFGLDNYSVAICTEDTVYQEKNVKKGVWFQKADYSAIIAELGSFCTTSLVYGTIGELHKFDSKYIPDNVLVKDQQTLTESEKTQVRTNIGLGNVDNTSDLNKPISTATQTALDAKETADVTILKQANVQDNYTSTSAIYPLSANKGKDLNERLQNVESRGRYLSTWNCVTGLPGTNPTTLPYTYKTGDYYIISNIGTTNYKPTGSSYTGAASTTVDSSTIAVNDTYLYDGTSWTLIHSTEQTVTFSSIAGQPTDNTNLASALNAKADSVHTHDDRYYTETEMDTKLAAKQDTIENLSYVALNTLEQTTNKVSSWSATTTDTHYPTEKLVKTALDAKASSSHTHTNGAPSATQTVLTGVSSAGAVPTLGTAIAADDITAWSAGSFTATPTETSSGSGVYNLTLAFTAPALSYTARSIPNVTDVGSMPTFSSGSAAGSTHTHTISGASNE